MASTKQAQSTAKQLSDARTKIKEMSGLLVEASESHAERVDAMEREHTEAVAKALDVVPPSAVNEIQRLRDMVADLTGAADRVREELTSQYERAGKEKDRIIANWESRSAHLRAQADDALTAWKDGPVSPRNMAIGIGLIVGFLVGAGLVLAVKAVG